MKPERLRITPGETLEVRSARPAVLVVEAAYAATPEPAGRIAVAALAGIARATARTPQRPARDLGALSGPLAGVTFVGGLAAGLAVADAPYPRPGAEPAAIRRYFEGSARGPDQHRRPAAVGGIARALHRHGRRSRARRALAPAARADDGSGRPRDRVAGRVRADQFGAHARRRREQCGRRRAAPAPVRRRRPGAHRRLGRAGRLPFAAGRRTERLPRALTAAGFATAAIGAISPVSLVAEPVGWLIPAGRVSGLLVSGIAGARLARSPAVRRGPGASGP
jgi:hypothetical protein